MLLAHTVAARAFMDAGGAAAGLCTPSCSCCSVFFFFQAEDGIRDLTVTGVQTCALPISRYYHSGRIVRPYSGCVNGMKFAGVDLRAGSCPGDHPLPPHVVQDLPLTNSPLTTGRGRLRYQSLRKPTRMSQFIHRLWSLRGFSYPFKNHKFFLTMPERQVYLRKIVGESGNEWFYPNDKYVSPADDEFAGVTEPVGDAACG